jgi:hypothetical protein
VIAMIKLHTLSLTLDDGTDLLFQATALRDGDNMNVAVICLNPPSLVSPGQSRKVQTVLSLVGNLLNTFQAAAKQLDNKPSSLFGKD